MSSRSRAAGERERATKEAVTEKARIAGIGGWASAVYEAHYGTPPRRVRAGGAPPSPLEVCLALQSPMGSIGRVRLGGLRAFAGDSYGVACEASETLAASLNPRTSGHARVLPWAGAGDVGDAVEASGPEGSAVVEGTLRWLEDMGPAPVSAGTPIELELSVAPEAATQSVFVAPPAVRAVVVSGERRVAGTLALSPEGVRFTAESEVGSTLCPRARFAGNVVSDSQGVWSLHLAPKGTLVTATMCGEVEWLVGAERVGLRVDRLAPLPNRAQPAAMEATTSMTLTVDTSMVERVSDVPSAVAAADAETVCLQRPGGRR